MTDHAWQRGRLLWDLYFAVVLAATLVMVQLEDHSTTRERLVAMALLAAMVPWYVLVGRSALGRPDNSPRGTLYVLGLIPMLGVAQANMGSSSHMLFALTTQCYMLLSIRRALLAVLGLNLVPLYFIVGGGLHWHPKAIAAAVILTGITFGGVFAIWIDRIIKQSRERADLIDELDATRAELAESHHREGMLAERQRLAAEIHDTLAQGFISILMLLQAAEPHVTADAARRPLELATRTARENLAEARALVAELPPAALHSAPLAEALRRLAGRLGEELGVVVSYETCGEPRTLTAGTEVVLLRAAQEALANIRRHAAARSASVRLEYDTEAVRLQVRDDGVGFQPGTTNDGIGFRPGTSNDGIGFRPGTSNDGIGFRPGTSDDGHFGLRGMLERVTQAGGRLTIDTAPGQGTCLTVELLITPA